MGAIVGRKVGFVLVLTAVGLCVGKEDDMVVGEMEGSVLETNEGCNDGASVTGNADGLRE